MNQQVIDLHPYAGQQVAIDWVREQYGLDPNWIPADSAIVIDHDARTLTYEEYEIGPDGKMIPAEDNTVVRRTVTKHFDQPIPEWP